MRARIAKLIDRIIEDFAKEAIPIDFERVEQYLLEEISKDILSKPKIT